MTTVSGTNIEEIPDIIDTVVVHEADVFCCAENMVLQATELGISSCIISRGEETFISPEGQALIKEWEIPENYSAICFVILGYIDGEQPHTVLFVCTMLYYIWHFDTRRICGNRKIW